MKCIDSRRLTGPNVLWALPGAVIDVRFDDEGPDRVIAVWEEQVRRMLDAVGWETEQTCVRRFSGGASLAIPGAGQAYNGQVWKGVAYLSASASLWTSIFSLLKRRAAPFF